MEISLRKIPILMISDVMNQIRANDPMKMVWYRGNVLSPTLPDVRMTF